MNSLSVPIYNKAATPATTSRPETPQLAARLAPPVATVLAVGVAVALSVVLLPTDVEDDVNKVVTGLDVMIAVEF